MHKKKQGQNVPELPNLTAYERMYIYLSLLSYYLLIACSLYTTYEKK